MISSSIYYTTALLVTKHTVVVCADLWGKELHRQVGMGIAVTSGVMIVHWPEMLEMWV